MEMMLGTVQAFAFNYIPRGWMFCDGSLLKIHDHQDLYSLLGTKYGGDGRDTFALPDLRGKVSVGAKTGMGNHIGIATAGNDTQALELNYCICVDGRFPPRS